MTIQHLGTYESARAARSYTDLAHRGPDSAERPRTTPRVAPRADQVTLSDEARTIVAARRAVAEADASRAREQRVAAIRRVILAGSYQVDTTVLARSMLRAAG